MTVALDSSALLAVIRNEPGNDRVLAVIGEAVMSTINHAEVVTRLVDRGSNAEDVSRITTPFGLTVIPFDVDQATQAGLIWTEGKRRGLSLGDRACLALARSLGAPVLTADRAWDGLEVGVEIEVIR